MNEYLRRLYLYTLALAVKEVNTDQLRGTVNDYSDYYLVSLNIKVPKQEEYKVKEEQTEL